MTDITRPSILVLEPMAIIQEDIIEILTPIARRCDIRAVANLKDAIHLAGALPHLVLAVISMRHATFDANCLDTILRHRACPTLLIDGHLSDLDLLENLHASLDKPFTEGHFLDAIRGLAQLS